MGGIQVKSRVVRTMLMTTSTLALAVPVAHAHDGEAGHAHPDPAPGAQPAAPAEIPAVPGAAAPAAVEVDPVTPGGVAPAVGAGRADEAAADEVVVEEPAAAALDVAAVATPVEPRTPAPAPARTTVDGGGTAVDVPSAPLVRGSGELPFTGAIENTLLILLAGMIVPIGVLLWCAAHRGERTRLQRSLSMPRFQWAPPR